jgi:uncharacterized membrane protein
MLDLARLVEIATQVHPVHPLLVHFPVALSFLGLLLVALAWWRADPFFEKAAHYDQGLLALSVIPAMAAGIFDNATRYVGNAPNGQLKITLSVLLLVIAAGAYVWRRRRPDLLTTSPGRYLYVLSFLACVGLVTILGFLGGIIVWGA